jgi:hypothetical protein
LSLSAKQSWEAAAADALRSVLNKSFSDGDMKLILRLCDYFVRTLVSPRFPGLSTEYRTYVVTVDFGRMDKTQLGALLPLTSATEHGFTTTSSSIASGGDVGDCAKTRTHLWRWFAPKEWAQEKQRMQALKAEQECPSWNLPKGANFEPFNGLFSPKEGERTLTEDFRRMLHRPTGLKTEDLQKCLRAASVRMRMPRGDDSEATFHTELGKLTAEIHSGRATLELVEEDPINMSLLYGAGDVVHAQPRDDDYAAQTKHEGRARLCVSVESVEALVIQEFAGQTYELRLAATEYTDPLAPIIMVSAEHKEGFEAVGEQAKGIAALRRGSNFGTSPQITFASPRDPTPTPPTATQSQRMQKSAAQQQRSRLKRFLQYRKDTVSGCIVEVQIISLPVYHKPLPDTGWHRLTKALEDKDSQYLLIERAVESPQYIQRLDLSKDPGSSSSSSGTAGVLTETIHLAGLGTVCICFKRDPLYTKFYNSSYEYPGCKLLKGEGWKAAVTRLLTKKLVVSADQVCVFDGEGVGMLSTHRIEYRHANSADGTLPTRHKVHVVHASIHTPLPYGRGGRFVTCDHDHSSSPASTAYHHWRWEQQTLTRVMSVDRLAVELQGHSADPSSPLDLTDLHQLWQRVRLQQCKIDLRLEGLVTVERRLVLTLAEDATEGANGSNRSPRRRQSSIVNATVSTFKGLLRPSELTSSPGASAGSAGVSKRSTWAKTIAVNECSFDVLADLLRQLGEKQEENAKREQAQHQQRMKKEDISMKRPASSASLRLELTELSSFGGPSAAGDGSFSNATERGGVRGADKFAAHHAVERYEEHEETRQHPRTNWHAVGARFNSHISAELVEIHHYDLTFSDAALGGGLGGGDTDVVKVLNANGFTEKDRGKRRHSSKRGARMFQSERDPQIQNATSPHGNGSSPQASPTSGHQSAFAHLPMHLLRHHGQSAFQHQHQHQHHLSWNGPVLKATLAFEELSKLHTKDKLRQHLSTQHNFKFKDAEEGEAMFKALEKLKASEMKHVSCKSDERDEAAAHATLNPHAADVAAAVSGEKTLDKNREKTLDKNPLEWEWPWKSLTISRHGNGIIYECAVDLGELRVCSAPFVLPRQEGMPQRPFRYYLFQVTRTRKSKAHAAKAAAEAATKADPESEHGSSSNAVYNNSDIPLPMHPIPIHLSKIHFFSDLKELGGSYNYVKEGSTKMRIASSDRSVESIGGAPALDLDHSEGVTRLVFDAGEEVVLHSYQWATASHSADYDPISWRLEGSNVSVEHLLEGSNMYPLDRNDGYNDPPLLQKQRQSTHVPTTPPLRPAGSKDTPAGFKDTPAGSSENNVDESTFLHSYDMGSMGMDSMGMGSKDTGKLRHGVPTARRAVVCGAQEGEEQVACISVGDDRCIYPLRTMMRDSRIRLSSRSPPLTPDLFFCLSSQVLARTEVVRSQNRKRFDDYIVWMLCLSVEGGRLCLFQGGTVDVQVVLWMYRWCCGCTGGAVDVQVVLWMYRWCCGCESGAVVVKALLWMCKWCCGCEIGAVDVQAALQTVSQTNDGNHQNACFAYSRISHVSHISHFSHISLGARTGDDTSNNSSQAKNTTSSLASHDDPRPKLDQLLATPPKKRAAKLESEYEAEVGESIGEMSF